jgi:type VI secretion system secreted protein Hcp
VPLVPVNKSGPAAKSTGEHAVGFVQMTGAAGSSNDKQRKDWIDVLSFRFDGATQPLGHGGEHFAASGKARMNGISFTKRIDPASPKLLEFCIFHAEMADVKFEFVHSFEGSSRVYYKIHLKNARVASVNLGTTEDQPGALTEHVALVFEKLKTEFVHFNEETKSQQTYSFEWNRQDAT